MSFRYLRAVTRSTRPSPAPFGHHRHPRRVPLRLPASGNLQGHDWPRGLPDGRDRRRPRRTRPHSYGARPHGGGSGPRDGGRDRAAGFAGKLTRHPAATSTLALSVFGDPRRFAGPIGGINGYPSTYIGTIDTGGTNLTLRYEGTVGGSLLVHALYGRHRQKWVLGGPATDEPRFDGLTVDPRPLEGASASAETSCQDATPTS